MVTAKSEFEDFYYKEIKLHESRNQSLTEASFDQQYSHCKACNACFCNSSCDRPKTCKECKACEDSSSGTYTTDITGTILSQ